MKHGTISAVNTHQLVMKLLASLSLIATEGALGHRLYTPTYSLYTNMFKRHVLVTFSKIISITDLITVLQLDILILQDSASAVE